MDGSRNDVQTGKLVVPIAEVRPDPEQPRKYFKKTALESLAESIRRRGHHVPIQVRRLPAGDTHKYEIVEGERRWRACQHAGQETIEVTISDTKLSRREQRLLSLILNHHREGHTHMEISDALQYQVSEGETVASVAEALGKSTSWVYQYLSLQKLIKELRDNMHPETDERKLLRFGEAVVLSALPTSKQSEVYHRMLRQPVRKRLSFARGRAEKITGVKRKGRPRDLRLHAQRFFEGLSANLETFLDMHKKEFASVVAGYSMPQLRKIKEQLENIRSQAGALVQCIDGALMIE